MSMINQYSIRILYGMFQIYLNKFFGTNTEFKHINWYLLTSLIRKHISFSLSLKHDTKAATTQTS